MYKKSSACFGNNSDEDEGDSTIVLSYAQQILAEANRSADMKKSAYRSTKHVAPTSNACERGFSVCKHIMSDYRKQMGPEKLEALMILRDNYDLWAGLNKGPRLIQMIMNAQKRESDERKKREEGKEGDEQGSSTTAQVLKKFFLDGY